MEVGGVVRGVVSGTVPGVLFGDVPGVVLFGLLFGFVLGTGAGPGAGVGRGTGIGLGFGLGFGFGVVAGLWLGLVVLGGTVVSFVLPGIGCLFGVVWLPGDVGWLGCPDGVCGVLPVPLPDPGVLCAYAPVVNIAARNNVDVLVRFITLPHLLHLLAWPSGAVKG